MLGAVLVLALGGCVALLASSDGVDDGNDGGANTEESAATTAETEESEEAEPAEDSDPIEESEPIEDTEPIEDAAGDDAMGTRAEPLAYGVPVDLTWRTFGDADGSRWTTTIDPPRDITDAVMAENEFNPPPPDGVRYVGFDVELTLIEAGKEPLAPSFNFSWEILGGATARVYDATTIETDSFGCGFIPGGFDDFAEVFVGGTLTGAVCIPIPSDDLDHPDTRVALHFSDDDRAVFGP